MKPTSTTQRSTVISLLKEGYSLCQIESKTGLGRSTIGRIKKVTGPFPYNVLAVVTPLDPVDSLCISPHEPPFPVIFRGYMNTQEKHDAIQSYSWKWLVFKGPFQDKSPSKDPEPKRHVAPVAFCEPILCPS